MLVLKWNAEHECKKHILANGINARIHIIKGGSFHFPESAEKVIRKKFSDALSCEYCVIEKVSKKKETFGSKAIPKLRVEADKTVSHDFDKGKIVSSKITENTEEDK